MAKTKSWNIIKLNKYNTKFQIHPHISRCRSISVRNGLVLRDAVPKLESSFWAHSLPRLEPRLEYRTDWIK